MTGLALTDRLPEWLDTEVVPTGTPAPAECSDEMDVERRLLAVVGLTTAPGLTGDESALARFAGFNQLSRESMDLSICGYTTGITPVLTLGGRTELSPTVSLLPTKWTGVL